MQPLSFFQECSRQLNFDEFDVLSAHGCVSPLGGVYWAQSVHPSWLERSARFRPPLSAARIKQRLNPLHKVLLQLEEKHLRERNYLKIIATTQAVKDDLNRFYGVPGEDVVILPNGFAPGEFNSDRRLERRKENRARLNLQPDQVALLFVANELERKGYPTILEALQILQEPRIRVVAVGRFDENEARRMAAQAGVADQVLICGSTHDVSAFHAAGDVFVLPTQYEAFSLAILEALGSGLPIITTRIPGANDAIEHEVNGWVMEDPCSGEELAGALRQFLDDDYRLRITNQVPATSLSYQWPHILARYEAELLSVIN